MNAAEIIALVAVGVTGVSILTNYLLSRKRLDHEKVLQEKRLAHEAELHESRLEHERVEAVRTTAATAYTQANGVLAHINPSTIYTIASDFEDGKEYDLRNAVTEAMEALGFVSALGWSAEVRDAAKGMLEAITHLANRAWATVWMIRREDRDITQAVERFEARFAEAVEAFEVYRRAVAGE